MSNRGYSLEHFVETEILRVSNQSKNLPIYERTYRVPTSGAMRSDKGDVKTKIPWKYPFQMIIECKDRKIKNKSGNIFRLNMDWLDKNLKESLEEKKRPLFVFSFKSCKKDRVWCILEYEDYKVFFNNKIKKINLKKNKNVIIKKDEINEFNFFEFGRKFVFIKFETFLNLIKNSLIKKSTNSN